MTTADNASGSSSPHKDSPGTLDAAHKDDSARSFEIQLEGPDGSNASGLRRRFKAVPGDKEPLVPVQLAKAWWLDTKSSYTDSYNTMSYLDWAGKVLPCVEWLRGYNVKELLLADLIAGVSVAAMVIPQGISYAANGGLPAIYGLFNAFVPTIMYAAFGSSRQISIGPVAIVYLLVYNGLKDVIPGFSAITNHNRLTAKQQPLQQEFNNMCIVCAMFVGIFQLALRFLRLSFLINLLSHSVISGFTTSVAVIYILQQVGKIMGFKTTSDTAVYKQLDSIFSNIDQFQWKEFVMGFSFLVTLLVLRAVAQKYRRLRILKAIGPLLVCIICVILVAAFDLEKHGISIVGNLPRGLPKATVNRWFPVRALGKVVVTAVIAAAVSLMDASAIGRALASKNGYQLNSDQEFMALGLANFVGSIFNATPVSGTFSRSAVSNEVGAKTQLAGIITAIVVGFCLLFLTPVFRLLTNNVLAAIIIVGLLSISNFSDVPFLWRVSKTDCLAWIVAFLATSFITVEIGLGISVGVALVLVIWESVFPHTAQLGRIPDTAVYRNVEQYPEARTEQNMLIVRFDAAIYFANSQFLKDKLQAYEAQAQAAQQANSSSGQLRIVILDLSPVAHIDVSAVHTLEDLLKDYKKRAIQLILVNPNKQVMRRLDLAGIPDKLGREWIFVRVLDAVTYAQEFLRSSLLIEGSTWLGKATKPDTTTV